MRQWKDLMILLREEKKREGEGKESEKAKCSKENKIPPILAVEFRNFLRKKRHFISNLDVECEIQDILNFFQDVELSVRLIVDYESKLVGCGFVEFASAIEAKKVLINTNRMREMTGDLINLDVAKIRVAQYPLRPKYNLTVKLWYGI